MKIGIVKLGSRISFSSLGTSGGNGEAVSIIKMLHKANQNIHIFTKILPKDNLLEDFNWYNIEDSYNDQETLDKLDCLLVLNGNVNFFGGAEDRAQILNYHIINRFKGKVFYIFCDPYLTLKQVYPSISKKEWGHKYNEGDILIKRKDITYVSQPFDIDKVKNLINKNICINNIVHFPFEKFPCLNERLDLNENYQIDLSYGGTMRNNRRYDKMLKFYFNYPSDIKVEMFGKIQSKDFQKDNDTINSYPSFSGPIKYDQMLCKMNESLSHVVIGDKLYEKINDMAQRAYESIQSSVITFIDSDLDKKRRVYGSRNDLADFLYVSSKEEVINKIRVLKEDKQARIDIVEEQFHTVNFNADEYCNDFVELLKENL